MPETGLSGSEGGGAFNPLSLPLSATDLDVPANTLTFALVSGPAGLTVSSGGIVKWTPTELQGPSTNTVTVKVTDDGTPPLSATNSFTVVVNEVNAPPTFIKGLDQSVDEDAGPQTVSPWATGLTVGTPGDAGHLESLSFLVNNDNSGLFSASPAIDSTGTLRYTPSPQTNGLAHVTVTLKDDGGTANGGKDTSDPQAFVIEVKLVASLKIENLRVSPADGTLSFAWPVRAGKRYQVEYKSSLAEATWKTLPRAPTIVGSRASLTDPLSEAGQRYYRVVEAN